MSSSNISASPGLTIKEVLRVFLIAYNSTITAFRQLSVTSFSTSQFGERYTKVTVDQLSRGGLPEGTTEAQEISYKKLNQCDTFCDIFFEEVKARLKPYQATVEYALVDPKPTIILLTNDDTRPASHSVLLIRPRYGAEIIFDGTAEQFGWPESNAIIYGNDFWHHYTLNEGYTDGSDSLNLSLEHLRTVHDGYWQKIGVSLRQMMRSLDWESLERMSTAAREEYIRVESAQRALAAAHACWG